MLKKFRIKFREHGDINVIEVLADSKSMAMFKFYMKHPSCDIEEIEELKDGSK